MRRTTGNGVLVIVVRATRETQMAEEVMVLVTVYSDHGST